MKRKNRETNAEIKGKKNTKKRKDKDEIKCGKNEEIILTIRSNAVLLCNKRPCSILLSRHFIYIYIYIYTYIHTYIHTYIYS
jgi:hypothetical protein